MREDTVNETSGSYTSWALKAITEAAAAEPDFPGWLAGVLARAAAARGSSYALIAGRPGSWEAALVNQLVCGTVGWDDEHLFSLDDPEIMGPADQRTAQRGTDQTPPG
jgi:hypothetical protein